LGIGKLQLLLGILLPQCKRTVREMFSYFFVNSMMTISAVSFLFNTNNKPIALMINQFEAQAQMEAAAVVSLLILIVNVAVKVLVQGDETATENNRRKQAK
jgi:iron(III) transport system permease protein